MLINFPLIVLTLAFCDAYLVGVDRVNVPVADLNAQSQGLPDITGLGPVRLSPQNQCHGMKVDATDILPGDWIVVKATSIASKPPPGYDLNVNSCSGFCYTPDVCGGVRMLIQDNNDRTMTFNTYSSNNLLKDIAHFETSVVKIDPIHSIYQANLLEMEVLTDINGGEFDDVDNVPPIVTETQNVPFVKISSSDAGMWMIFTTCDENPRTWVLLSHDAAQNQDQYNKYKIEYDQALAFVSGVDTNALVDIPLADYYNV